MTLCFLGSVERGGDGRDRRRMWGGRGMPAASLQRWRRGSGCLRGARGVLAVELFDDGGRLGAVQAALSEALAAGGWYEPESGRFSRT